MLYCFLQVTSFFLVQRDAFSRQGVYRTDAGRWCSFLLLLPSFPRSWLSCGMNLYILSSLVLGELEWWVKAMQYISTHNITGLCREKHGLQHWKRCQGQGKGRYMNSQSLLLFLFPRVSWSVVHVHPCDGAEGEGAASARGAAPVRLGQGCEGCVHRPEKPFHGSSQ